MSGYQTAHESLESWNASLQAICGRFETRMAFNRALFIGDIHQQCHAGLAVAHLRTNAGSIARQAIKHDHDDDQYCFLVSQRSGYAQVAQNGTNIQLAPGDLLLMDSVGSCEITPFGLIEHASLHLPREAVNRALSAGQRKFGKISSACASGRMLHLLMDQLCREADGSNQDQALESAFVSLLAPALAHDDTPELATDGVHGASLRNHVHQLIDDSLSQPNLSPLSLASRLNISVRHLYRLFEEQNDSVCRYIQRARLRRSAEDLANPFLRSESITSIAYKWGFTDSAHFSRAFKKQFELSPKDYRGMALMETAGAA